MNMLQQSNLHFQISLCKMLRDTEESEPQTVTFTFTQQVLGKYLLLVRRPEVEGAITSD